MVSSIVPGNSVEFEAIGINCVTIDPYADNPRYPTMIINGNTENIDSFLLISITAPYDNITFSQTEALTEAGISVTPYGFVIYPHTESMVTSPSVSIPVKCCGKVGTLVLSSQNINNLRTNNYPIHITVTLTDPEE